MNLQPIAQFASLPLTTEGDVQVGWERPRSDVTLAGQMHLWRLELDRATDANVLEGMSLLSAEESQRAGRLSDPLRRRRFVVRRASLRFILGGYVSVSPEELKFESNCWGKPRLIQDRAHESQRIEFNASHRDGLGLIAVGRGRVIGVDVERQEQGEETIQSVSREFFSTTEREALDRSTGEHRRELFVRLWTRKEAILKAQGLGVGGLPADARDREIDESARRFHISHFTPSPGFVACLAVARGS